MDELKVGLVINQSYRLIQYIGSGSFGEVWMAKDIEGDKDIAIKFYLSLDEKGRDEFMSEYKVAYGLSHPNLVVTEKYDTWQTRPFLVMKYCAKGSSSKAIGNLKPSACDEKFLWQFLHDVAAGLAYLHNQTPDPIVHQDIKPDNILVDSDGRFLISDFGISKRIRGTLRAQSSRALMAGATAYMGPERFTKNPAPVTASDIWSLGASLYELAEGELPFSGLGGIFLKNGGEMAELGDGWTEELDDVMKKCLSRETWDRIKAFELEEKAAKILADYEGWYVTAKKKGIEVSATDTRSTKRRIDVTDNPFTSADIVNRRVRQNSAKSNDIDTANATDMGGKSKFIAAVSVVALAIVACIAYFFIAGSKQSAKADEVYNGEYVRAIAACKQNIESGSQADVKKLILAKEELASIDSIEAIYGSENSGKFCEGVKLRDMYEAKARPAAEAWANSAKAQIDELGNVERAIEYYELSYSLYATPNVKMEIERLKNK